ncbi:MAG: ParB/RepB/Spo0J family partition protein [Clostridia bacterium]|nr:ParB/RepB/Spo0J family partition protein [Clostridia bacterium]
MAKGLGRGLSALFSDTEEAYENAKTETAEGSGSGKGGVEEISIRDIFPNPDQPRKEFDGDALFDLMKSIKEHGIINPIVVSPRDGQYMIIAGERRYRAAQMAGLEKVPVIVKDYSEKEIQEISLIENLQREDLNPIEAAYGMKKLMEEYKLTQEVLAERLGKSRPAIANTLRLLTLDDAVISLVREGKLSSGHARTLVPVPKEEQRAIAAECVKNGWSVREAERAVKQYLNPPEVLAKEKEKKNALQNAELKHLVERLRTALKTKVSLIGTDKKGRIYIDYYSRDDLDRLSEILDIIERQE